MDISKFYELRTRLCKTAAAGCMTIPEDFRLKRAVEDFKPLASANKAFEKLYLLCEKLFSEKPEAVLPDCIALADALAVTQGIFSDKAETKPAAGAYVSAQKTLSALTSVKELIQKSEKALWKLSADYKDTLRDPRILKAFLDELENSKFSSNFDIFCEIMCEICGKSLVPALKATIKNSGRQLQYIVKLFGDEENEFFRALATDEKSPENVRLAAISALSCSLENSALLVELFNTGKTQIKRAALLAMAEMDAPEAEPIFEKLLENYEKNKNLLAEPIIASSGKACTEFVRKYLLELDRESRSESENSLKAAGELANGADLMLTNKADLDDVYMALEAGDNSGKNSKRRNNSNNVLIRGLVGKNKAAVRAQIDRLYAKAPNAFREAKVNSDLFNDPASEPVVPNDQYNRNAILKTIGYIPLLGGYYKTLNLPFSFLSILPDTYYERFYFPSLSLPPICRLSDRFPGWLIRYICDTADNVEKRFKSLEAPTRNEMVEKAKALGYNEASIFTQKYDALQGAYCALRYELDYILYWLSDTGLLKCAPEDFEPLRQAAMYITRKCLPFFGKMYFIKLINYCPEITPQEYADMLIDFIVNDMVINLQIITYDKLSAVSERLTPEELTVALTKLRARISEWGDKIEGYYVKNCLSTIKEYMVKMQSKG